MRVSDGSKDASKLDAARSAASASRSAVGAGGARDIVNGESAPHASFIGGSPRMVAQRRAIASLSGATVQLNKTQHDVGDLHYGISDPRYKGFTAMAPNPAASNPKHVSDENPVSVDTLNADAKITEKLEAPDTTAGYFLAMDMIKTYTLPSAPAKKWERWLGFLNTRQASLDLSKLVTQIQSPSTPATPSKDKLNKNGDAPTGGLNETGKRDAIVAAFSAKQTAAADPAYQALVDGWVWDAFFRKTSKLGIDFTVAEGKVVHFNMDAPGNLAKGRLPTTVNAAAEANAPGRQPITHSEIRHVNRQGLIGGPHMDIYRDESQVNQPRDPDAGKMPTYMSGRP